MQRTDGLLSLLYCRHRAKFLRAKRMVGNNMASVNEILGIASGSASPSVSGTSTPKTYAGPGGSQIALMDVDKRLESEAVAGSSSSVSESSSESEDEESAKSSKSKSKSKKRSADDDKKDEKKKKNHRKGKSKASDDDEDEKSEAEKRARKKAKKDKKRSSKGKEAGSETEPSAASTPRTLTAAAATATRDATEEGDSQVQIGTNSRGLHVFEYLSQQLMRRQAQIARKKKEEGEALWARAATVGA